MRPPKKHRRTVQSLLQRSPRTLVMCPASTRTEVLSMKANTHVCCALLSFQVLLLRSASSRPDTRRAFCDLVSRSTVSQHACPCSCLVMSHFRCHCPWVAVQSQSPRVVLSKNLASRFRPRDFSASRTARLRDVVWSRLCRIQHGVRAVGFVLSIKIQPPPGDARHRVEESAASPPAPRVGFCVSRQNSWP